MLADNEMDIHQSRLVIWHAAWVLDREERGTHEPSMTKVLCSEAIWRVVDRNMRRLPGRRSCVNMRGDVKTSLRSMPALLVTTTTS
jgi:alkylation response protein AidB-like acyl-CoA dehydrogenase